MAEQSLGVLVTFGGTTDENQPRFDADKYLEDSRGGFTAEQIKAGFDLVKDPEHWKNAIDAVIDRDQVDLVRVAIAWYTATEAEFTDTDNPDQVRVTATGYFNGPAGP